MCRGYCPWGRALVSSCVAAGLGVRGFSQIEGRIAGRPGEAPSFWSWNPRCLLSRRRSVSAPPGLLTAPPPPFSPPAAEIKNGAQAPQDGVPGRPAVQDCTILRRTRLPCSPSLKQAGRQAAAAPGEIATGAAAAAPPASHRSLGAGRRVPDSPRGVRSALAARAECPGLPQPHRRPGRPCQATGGAPARISRSGRERSARIKRPSRPPSWLLLNNYEVITS
ncbi:hypothetical protein NDU88_002100 [Pleurodeles waltl]|uniref:Uncharacterized protein n=1 Tax=Pleurodeles waltl TaxID=8319 RepID=A0AAV7NFD1_PLEWA|nr:hypothetical protein NDU88_002100 [Pleurodeles waltl]